MSSAAFVRSSDVLFTIENKNRATALLHSIGFQLPVRLQRYGSVGSITYEGQNVNINGVKFETLETSVPTKKEDTSTLLPKAVLNRTNATQEIPSIDNIAQSGTESNSTEPEKINFADAKTERQRYQLAQQADRDAKKSNQQQASRAIAERDALFRTAAENAGVAGAMGMESTEWL